MEKKLLVLLFSLTSLALVACGGGNDVASSGTTAVSAAAPVTTTAATTASTPTEAKVNGQVDERTGVAPVAAQITPWSPTANGGCGNSSFWGGLGTGPALTPTQQNACANALTNASTSQCTALGGYMQGCYSAQCISIVAAKMMGC
jgi:hypothetical protein